MDASKASPLCHHAAKPRAILTEEQAVAIFSLRGSSTYAQSRQSTDAVARSFKVSEKTVRDIWNGRTWHRETLHLDPSRPLREIVPPGRPAGRKDSAPRRRPCKEETEQATRKNADTVDNIPCHEVLTPGPAARESAPSRSEAHKGWVPTPNDSVGTELTATADPFHDDWPHWERATSLQGLDAGICCRCHAPLAVAAQSAPRTSEPLSHPHVCGCLPPGPTLTSLRAAWTGPLSTVGRREKGHGWPHGDIPGRHQAPAALAPGPAAAQWLPSRRTAPSGGSAAAAQDDFPHLHPRRDLPGSGWW